MSDFVVTEDQMGGLHLYETNFTRPKPIAEWHGFQSYQDLADFLTFALRGPSVDPLDMSMHPAVAPGPGTGQTIYIPTPEVFMQPKPLVERLEEARNEMTKEGRRGEYSPRPDDGVPSPLTTLFSEQVNNDDHPCRSFSESEARDQCKHCGWTLDAHLDYEEARGR